MNVYVKVCFHVCMSLSVSLCHVTLFLSPLHSPSPHLFFFIYLYVSFVPIIPSSPLTFNYLPIYMFSSFYHRQISSLHYIQPPVFVTCIFSFFSLCLYNSVFIYLLSIHLSWSLPSPLVLPRCPTIFPQYISHLPLSSSSSYTLLLPIFILFILFSLSFTFPYSSPFVLPSLSSFILSSLLTWIILTLFFFVLDEWLLSLSVCESQKMCLSAWLSLTSASWRIRKEELHRDTNNIKIDWQIERQFDTDR